MGIGIDIVNVERTKRLWVGYPTEVLSVVFSDREVRVNLASSNPSRAFATCFGGKEALSKALGSSLFALAWPEIEVFREGSQLRIELSGGVADAATRQGIRAWDACWWEMEKWVIVAVLSLRDEHMRDGYTGGLLGRFLRRPASTAQFS